MTDIRCQKCDQHFEADFSGHISALCPYCGWKVPRELANPITQDKPSTTESEHCFKCKIVFTHESQPVEQCWDQLSYCGRCVEEAGLSDFLHQPPEESVRFRLKSALLRGLWSYLWLTSMMTGMLLAFIFLIMIAGIVGGLVPVVPGPGRVIFALCAFAGFAFLFVSVISFPMSMLFALFRRKMDFRIENNNFVAKCGSRTTNTELAECQWQPQTMGTDSRGAYLPRRPVIQVRMSEQAWIVCGFDERMRRFWSGYLSLRDVSRIQPAKIRERVMAGVLYISTGGVLGASVGFVFQLITGDANWVTSLMLMGFFDGVIVLLMELGLRSNNRALNKRHPAIWALVFAVLGMKSGGLLDRQGLLVCGLLNFGLGMLIAIYYSKKFKAIEADGCEPL